jgi:hypothetical protein
MKNTLKYLLLAFTSGLILTSCDKEDDDLPPVTNEGELITTLTLTMTDSANTTDVKTATFRDSDGPGGNPPTLFQEINLKPNSTYQTTITILDESKSPSEDITAEIAQEKEDHQFFYTPNTSLNATIKYRDKDANNLPVGLLTTIKTGAASTGKLKVTLKHQPGIKNNSITTGDTDAEIDFTARIQ